jgi:hypothetical protein
MDQTVIRKEKNAALCSSILFVSFTSSLTVYVQVLAKSKEKKERRKARARQNSSTRGMAREPGMLINDARISCQV